MLFNDSKPSDAGFRKGPASLFLMIFLSLCSLNAMDTRSFSVRDTLLIPWEQLGVQPPSGDSSEYALPVIASFSVSPEQDLIYLLIQDSQQILACRNAEVQNVYPLSSAAEYRFRFSSDRAVIHTISKNVYRKYLRGRLVESFFISNPVHVLTGMIALDPSAESVLLTVNGTVRLLKDLDNSRRYMLFDGIPLSNGSLLSLRRDQDLYLLQMNSRTIYRGGSDRLHTVEFIGEDPNAFLWIYDESFLPEDSRRRTRLVTVCDSLGVVQAQLKLPRTAYSKIILPYSLNENGVFYTLYSLAGGLQLISFELSIDSPVLTPDSLFQTGAFDDFRFDDPIEIPALLDSNSLQPQDGILNPSDLHGEPVPYPEFPGTRPLEGYDDSLNR